MFGWQYQSPLRQRRNPGSPLVGRIEVLDGGEFREPPAPYQKSFGDKVTSLYFKSLWQTFKAFVAICAGLMIFVVIYFWAGVLGLVH